MHYVPSEAAYRARNKVLTEREIQVLCMAAVMSDKMVGKRLGITTKTVCWHLNMMRHKLGVSSTGAAVFTLLGRGVICLEDITPYLSACKWL